MSRDASYGDDEVRAIIARALEAQPASSAAGTSHEDLLAIGEGVGLSREAIEQAAREVQAARLNDSALASVRRRRRRGLLAHAVVFALVNALLFAVNFLTTPGEWWVLFSVFGWGLGLALHALFGLGSGISTRRLEREKRRLVQGRAAGSAPARDATPPRAGVRVASPAENAAESEEAEPAPLERKRGSL